MEKGTIKKLCNNPALVKACAQWFSAKWGIPLDAYLDSIQACIKNPNSIPQWYVMIDCNNDIIAGAGIIENDFHDRKDLHPNLCALFVEPLYRKQGIAKDLLDFAREDAGRLGIQTLYLVTEHTTFYERCGWEFLTIVRDDEGAPERMYVAHT